MVTVRLVSVSVSPKCHICCIMGHRSGIHDSTLWRSDVDNLVDVAGLVAATVLGLVRHAMRVGSCDASAALFLRRLARMEHCT
jgi:hypothetical protein